MLYNLRYNVKKVGCFIYHKKYNQSITTNQLIIAKMAKQLFKLRNVPDDEADDVRELLAEHQFDTYETTAGFWGTAAPAIWLKDEAQFEQARSLIDAYQQKRAAAARANYEQECKKGTARSTTDIIKENPLKYGFYILGILAVLYICFVPILSLLNKGS